MKVVNLYKKRGFVIDICLMNNEFESVRGILQEQQIQSNICAPNEHVPEVERKIRTVKERVRGIITTLPFQTIPTIIIIHAVIFSVMWLNFFPPKEGVSITLSPQAIITGLYPDANNHCRMPFGAYAQVHGEPEHGNNAMVSRTVGGISLGPTGNIQGTYKFMSLLTGRLIKARSFTPLPMPDEVINMVERIELSDITEHHCRENKFDNQDLNSPPFDDVSLDVDSETSAKELDNLIQDDASKHETIQDDSNDVPLQVSFDPRPVLESVSSDKTYVEENEDEKGEMLYNKNEDEKEKVADNINETTVDENMETDEVGDEGVLPRTRYITRSGRHVRINKDIFQNYDLLQVDRYKWGIQHIQDKIKVKFSPNTQTPSIQNTFGLKPMDEIPRCQSHSQHVMIQCAFTQYSLKQGLKAFPVEARDATIAEITQLYEMQVFQSVHKSSLTYQELLRVINSITFIKQKRCGKIKARTCADGRPQRAIFEKWEATSHISSRCLRKTSHCCI
jgi:hypothetical protein